MNLRKNAATPVIRSGAKDPRIRIFVPIQGSFVGPTDQDASSGGFVPRNHCLTYDEFTPRKSNQFDGSRVPGRLALRRLFARAEAPLLAHPVLWKSRPSPSRIPARVH